MKQTFLITEETADAEHVQYVYACARSVRVCDCAWVVRLFIYTPSHIIHTYNQGGVNKIRIEKHYFSNHRQ